MLNILENKNYNEIIFSKAQELKQLTINQKKALMAGDLDVYITIEKVRASLRKEISEIKNKVLFNKNEYKVYITNLKEMLNLEKDNQRIILEWKVKTEEEENKLRNVKKFATTYFNAKSLPNNPRFINKVT